MKMISQKLLMRLVLLWLILILIILIILILLKNSLIEGMILIILSWILGMSIIGVIFNIFFIYMKSFTIGFSISSFILVYKYKRNIILINICNTKSVN